MSEEKTHPEHIETRMVSTFFKKNYTHFFHQQLIQQCSKSCRNYSKLLSILFWELYEKCVINIFSIDSMYGIVWQEFLLYGIVRQAFSVYGGQPGHLMTTPTSGLRILENKNFFQCSAFFWQCSIWLFMLRQEFNMWCHKQTISEMLWICLYIDVPR